MLQVSQSTHPKLPLRLWVLYWLSSEGVLRCTFLLGNVENEELKWAHPQGNPGVEQRANASRDQQLQEHDAQHLLHKVLAEGRVTECPRILWNPQAGLHVP